MAGRRPLADRVREELHGNASEASVWLRVHYARLRPRMAVRYPPYAEVAAEMNAAGVKGGKDAKGGGHRRVTADTVYRAWRRIVREREGKPAAKPGRAGPAGWKPEPVAAPAGAPPAAPGGDIERLRAWMKNRSGIGG